MMIADIAVHSARPLVLRRSICASSLNPWSKTCSPMSSTRVGLQNSDRMQRRYKGYIAPPGEQARPITGFYAEMLKKAPSQTPPSNQAATPPPPPQPSQPPPDSPPKTQKEITLERARTVFGSKPGVRERRIEIDAASKQVAGISVPPKPTEPDNCCMSGCVNCVWDMFRDEMEEWAEKSALARAALQARRDQATGTGSMVADEASPSHVAVSMDDDGGGSEANWSAGVGQDKLFDDIPVGIREFMKTEKKLKQKHREEQVTT